MKISDLLEKLRDYKPGTFVSIEWERDISSAKAKKEGVRVFKHSSGVFRVDVDYKNLSKVQTSSNTESTKEAWFTHSNLHDAIVESKRDPEKKYLQVFLGANNRVKSEMKLGDKIETPDELYSKGYINKSSIPSKDEILTFTLGIENIVRFGK